MERSQPVEQPGARLARSYLAVRAEQVVESQPKTRGDGVLGSVRLPRLDSVHLSSPEAHAQYRLALLAQLALNGEPWLTLAPHEPPHRR